jgi:hypothetical protein
MDRLDMLWCYDVHHVQYQGLDHLDMPRYKHVFTMEQKGMDLLDMLRCYDVHHVQYQGLYHLEPDVLRCKHLHHGAKK